MSYDDEFEARERRAAKELHRRKVAAFSPSEKLGYYVIAPLMLIAALALIALAVVAAARWALGL